MVDLLKCYMCEREQHSGSMQEVDLYDGPFDTAPQVENICVIPPEDWRKEYLYDSCYDALFSSEHTSFNYQECAGCNRIICVRYKRNGWHEHFRNIDDEQICLRCYEEVLLLDGVDRDDIEAGKLPGMFFSHGNPELKEAGFTEIGPRFIRSDESIQRVKMEILELMDSGHIVIIGYERMAEGGGEGTISIHAKNVTATGGV